MKSLSDDDDDKWLPWEGPERGFDKLKKTQETKKKEGNYTTIDLSAYLEPADDIDMADLFKAHKNYDKDRKENNLKKSEELDDGKWTHHTEYHWSRQLCGKRLDYWPSRNKFQYGKGRVMVGDVFGFIRNREREEGCHGN